MAGGKHNHHWFFRGKKREFGTFNLTTMVMSGSAFFAMTNRRQSKLKGDKVVWGKEKYGNGNKPERIWLLFSRRFSHVQTLDVVLKTT